MYKKTHAVFLHADLCYFQNGEVFLLVRDGVQYPRIFPIHSRINPFYSRNFTFITQEITNTLLKKFECPYP